MQENLAAAFPQKSVRERTLLAKSFYRQLSHVALEILQSRQMTLRDFQHRIHLQNPQLLKELSNNFADPIIIVSIHQGNWEWMLHGMRAVLEIPIDPIYKPLHNATADRLMLEIRSQFGARPLVATTSARDILRNRREFRALAILADQSPTRHERSHWATFFHRPAAFHTGFAALAKLTNSAVVFAQCRRSSNGHYNIEFHSLGRPPKSPEDQQLMVERFIDLSEKAIRAEPQSWLWSNRRWKRQPTD